MTAFTFEIQNNNRTFILLHCYDNNNRNSIIKWAPKKIPLAKASESEKRKKKKTRNSCY